MGISIPAVIMMTSDMGAGLKYLIPYLGLFQKADQFITNCSAEKKILASAFQTKLSIKTIPLPIPIKASKKNSARALDFLYIGRISVQKNIHSLLAIIRRLKLSHPNICLKIMGSPDELGNIFYPNKNKDRYFHELHKYIVRYNLEKNICFLGYLNKHQLIEEINKSLAVISASLHSGEDFGYAIAQAIALKKTVFVSHWGGGVDFIKHCNCHSLPVLTMKNGLVLDFDLAIKKISGFIQKPSSFRKPKSPYLISAKNKWLSVFRKTRSNSLFSSQKMKIKKDFLWLRRAEKRKTPRFRSSTDSRFIQMALLYGAQKAPKICKAYSWNPLFDPELKLLWDPMAQMRTMPESRKHSDFVDRWKNNSKILYKNLTASDKKIVKQLYSLSILLPGHVVSEASFTYAD